MAGLNYNNKGMALALVLLIAACGGDNEPPVVTRSAAPSSAAVASAPAPPAAPAAPAVAEAPETAASNDAATSTEEKVDAPSEESAEAENTLALPQVLTGDDNDTSKAVIDSIRSSLRNIRESDQSITRIIENLDNRSAQFEVSTAEETSSQAQDQNGVVWSIDTSPRAQVKPESAIIPKGQDPSLAEDALTAAFALVRQQKGLAEDQLELPTEASLVPPKQPGKFRIALLLPYNGRAAAVAQDIRSGAELAMFKLKKKNVDLVFFDTSRNVELATREAINSGADVILGPLFSESTSLASLQTEKLLMPLLSFSNDIDVTMPGVYLLGQTPEQEIETAITYMAENIKPLEEAGRAKLSVALISQASPYGRRVASRARARLAEAGVTPRQDIVFEPEILADEKKLRATVEFLTEWVPLAEGQPAPPPKFDVVIIAGDVPFSLRVAPIMSWYDLDATRTSFIGTSLWSSPAILQEPSLAGAIFAAAPASRRAVFDAMWQEADGAPLGKFAVMGFDAVALVSTLSHLDKDKFRFELINERGFSGFSGRFKLLPEGSNIRLLDMRRITNGTSEVIAEAAEKF